MNNQLIGEIILFAGNFAPAGWALCNGALLPIGKNPALFSIIGTTYGGDGTTNFALPKLPNVGNAIYLIGLQGQLPHRP